MLLAEVLSEDFESELDDVEEDVDDESDELDPESELELLSVLLDEPLGMVDDVPPRVSVL